MWTNLIWIITLPLLLTFTTLPGCTIAVLINQGRPKQTKMSKTLLPMAFDTAISPWPEYQREKNWETNVNGSYVMWCVQKLTTNVLINPMFLHFMATNLNCSSIKFHIICYLNYMVCRLLSYHISNFVIILSYFESNLFLKTRIKLFIS